MVNISKEDLQLLIQSGIEEAQKPQVKSLNIQSVALGVCSFLMIFIFIEMWDSNKNQDKSIAKLEETVAIHDYRLDNVEKVRYTQ